jgi:hypothetical protein
MVGVAILAFCSWTMTVSRAALMPSALGSLCFVSRNKRILPSVGANSILFLLLHPNGETTRVLLGRYDCDETILSVIREFGQ